MKKSTYLMLLMLGIFTFTNSCKKSILDVNEEFYISTSMDVVGSNAAFTGEELLDAVAESDLIDKYASHIKSIEILEVKYYVSYFNGTLTQKINNGVFSIADANGNGVYQMASVSDINLSQATIESALSFNQTAVDKLSDLIKNDPHKAMVYLSGDVNETPVDFIVTLKFKIKMVAEVI